jgi:geranylgeranyl diphosphate synthase type I
MLNSAGLTHEQYARTISYYNEMRVELMAGQFLDIHEQTQKSSSVDRSMKIARFKSGKYTIERPLHLGAAMANPIDKKTMVALSECGLPLGEAFQLRDDLLGVYGDASITGKPASDDLREGKKTVLIALSRENQSPSQAQSFDKYFGSPNLDSEGITCLQQIILDTGAKDKLEKMIEELTETSLAAIDSPCFTEEGQQLLRELAHIATKRSN